MTRGNHSAGSEGASRAQRPRARGGPAWPRFLQPPASSADLATGVSPPLRQDPVCPRRGGGRRPIWGWGPGSWASAKPAPTTATGGQWALWVHPALLLEGGAPPDSAQGQEDPEAPHTATEAGRGKGGLTCCPQAAGTCQQPPPTPAWADRCRPHGPPVAELPVAVEGLQHAAGRLPLGQEQQHRPVPGQALGGTGVTAVGRARGRGASPGWPAPPRRALPEEGRAGRTPHTRARCSARPVCPRECWGGAGHLGSWGAWSGGLIRVKDFVPETQGEWPPSRLSCGGHHEANRVPRAWAGGTDLARWGGLVP